MERGQTHAAVLQGADRHAAFKGAFHSRFDGVHRCNIHIFHNGCKGEVCEVRSGQEPVGVDADDVGVTAFFDRSCSTQAYRACDRHNDVRAFVHQGLAHRAPVIGAFEVAGEEPSRGPRIPSENFYFRALLLVIVAHAKRIAVHEDGHGRDLDAAESAYFSGLGHAGCQIASQEAGLVGVEHLPQDIRHRRIVGVVYDRKFLIGIRFR